MLMTVFAMHVKLANTKQSRAVHRVFHVLPVSIQQILLLIRIHVFNAQSTQIHYWQAVVCRTAHATLEQKGQAGARARCVSRENTMHNKTWRAFFAPSTLTRQWAAKRKATVFVMMECWKEVLVFRFVCQCALRGFME